jgi:hypothetical protein
MAVHVCFSSQVVTLTWALSHSCSTADHMWSQRFEAATLSRLQCLSLTQLTTLLKVSRGMVTTEEHWGSSIQCGLLPKDCAD